MSLIQYAKSGNIKKFKQNLKEISKKENKSTFVLFNHFLLTFIKSGCGYSDYLNYELYKKTFKEISEYVTIKDQDKFYEIVYEDKYAFYKLWKALPDILDDVIEGNDSAMLKNTVYDELDKTDFYKSLYILAFKTYEGFDNF